MVRALAPDHVVLRYFTVYGPGQRPDMAATRFIAAARADRTLPVFGRGDQLRAHTFVDDVVDATLRALTTPEATGATCNIAGDQPTTTRELAEAVGVALGRPLTLDALPPAPSDVARTAADTTRARALLGWRPITSLAEGLARQVAA